MTGIERSRDTSLQGHVLPDDRESLREDLEWMRLAYTLEYPARPNSWERPEDYPQAWNVRAYIDAEILESDVDLLGADAEGRVPVAEAKVYVIPDVGAINLWETFDAHSAELAQFAEAFMAAGSRSDSLTVRGEHFFQGDLMIVSWVHVQPRFRGFRVGHQVLKAILHAVGRGTVLVALLAAPGLRDGMEEGSDEHTMEAEALGRYWAELGFRPLRDRIMTLNYDDLIVMLADDDLEDDEDLDDDEPGSLSAVERERVLKELGTDTDD